MASPRKALLLALTACLFLAAAGPSSAQRADPPSIRPGDFWTYRTNTSLSEGFSLAGTATFTVNARETLNVSGAERDAFRVLVQGDGTIRGEIPTGFGPIPVSGTWDLVGEEILEAAGLKVVSSFINLLALGVTEPFDQPFMLRVRNSTTLAISEDAWRFPVGVGDTGHVTASFDTWENVSFAFGFLNEASNVTGVGLRTLSYRLEASAMVDAPAGRFEAYRINETWPDGRHSLLFFAPAAGNNARTESYNETGTRVATTELASYRYQALEPPTFLGLTLVQWGVVILPVATAGIASAGWMRSRRRRRAPPEGP